VQLCTLEQHILFNFFSTIHVVLIQWQKCNSRQTLRY